MHMQAWGLVAWYLVDKRGAKADPWEWGGLGFDFGLLDLIPWCVGGGHEAGIEGEGG